MQTYTVEIDDGHGGTATQLVTITITGTNDAAVITGDTTGAVVEAGGVDNGTPGIADRHRRPRRHRRRTIRTTPGRWSAPRPRAPTATARYTLTAAGVWTYTLDNTNAAVQALAVGGTLTDSFTVTTIDGTAQVVTITITGTNDAPVVTGAVDSGTVTEGSLPVMTADGTIDFGDVDLDRRSRHVGDARRRRLPRHLRRRT